VGSDFRRAVRSLIRERRFSVWAVTALTLTIAATTAAFAVVDTVLIRPLPYWNPEQLVAVWQLDRTDRSWFTVAPANFLDWQKNGRVFQALAAIQQFQEVQFNLMAGSAPESIRGIRFSPDLFRVLGVAPLIGRPFDGADAEPGHDHVALLAYQLWSGRFGRNPAIIGHTLSINGVPTTVIGVMPRGFEVPLVNAQIYLPLAWSPAQRQERRVAGYLVLGRLVQGVTIDSASAELESVARTLERQFPDTNRDVGILIRPLREEVVGNVRPSLVIVFASAAVVLLLACFNVANLFTVRALQRQRELAVRAALGAGRRQLARLVLTESALVALVSGMFGIVAGAVAVGAFTSLFNDTHYFSLPRRAAVAIDARVLAFVLLTCIVAALLFSAAPTLAVIRSNVAEGLRQGDGRHSTRWRGALLTAELGVSLMLFIAAVMLTRGYLALRAERAGFSSSGVLTAKVALPLNRYASPMTCAAFFDRTIGELARTPQVVSAAAVQFLPLGGVASVWPVSISERPTQTVPAAFHFIVTPTYFATMRIPLLLGRAFGPHDIAGTRRVAMLGETAAQQYFPGANPLGRSIRIDDDAHATWEIVGVVDDVRNMRLDRSPRPEVYVPMAQSPTGAMTLVVRTATGSPLLVAGAVQDVVRRMDPEQAVADVKTLEHIVDDSTARWRVPMALVLGFAGIAFVLSLGGLYSVVSYAITTRYREIGIRRALGASRAAVIALVLRSMGHVAVAGTAMGIVLAMVVVRWLSSVVYSVRATDGMLYAAASLAFAAAIIGAALVCAWSATRIEPSAALRLE
jgi:putative ABC transport system permease protein